MKETGIYYVTYISAPLYCVPNIFACRTRTTWYRAGRTYWAPIDTSLSSLLRRQSCVSSTTAFQDDLVTIKLCVQTGLTLIMLAAWETRNTEIPHGTHYWALLTSPQRAAVFTLIIPRTSCQARAVFTVLGHTGLQVLWPSARQTVGPAWNWRHEPTSHCHLVRLWCSQFTNQTAHSQCSQLCFLYVFSWTMSVFMWSSYM